ncbi:MAG: hypothetical protein V3U11_01200 [Planctomycetota bacterium]
MRWALAGISFAFLVALALATAAAKAENVRTRALIEETFMDVETCRMEVEWRSLELRDSPEYLARLWREVQSQELADSR